MHLLLLFCFSHLVLILGPIEDLFEESKKYSFIIFFFHFILFDLIQFNYAEVYVSFHFDLLHYFLIWELYPFTSNYVPSLHGKNSTFFHYKLHPNICTKNMNSSHKCIYLFFTLEKQLQIIHRQ